MHAPCEGSPSPTRSSSQERSISKLFVIACSMTSSAAICPSRKISTARSLDSQPPASAYGSLVSENWAASISSTMLGSLRAISSVFWKATWEMRKRARRLSRHVA